ncbi:Protein SOSEKI 5 [Linum perenne]
MAVSSRGRNSEQLLRLPRKWTDDREPTPDRLRVSGHNLSGAGFDGTERKVPVVYYLSRDGHLEHPHFMEVTLSSSQGLFLRDVIGRLNALRGKGIAALYSWSCKRSYRNGFVWHDLAESDFIYPAHGNEYVLKGSELLEPSPPRRKSFVESSASFRSTKIPTADQNHKSSSPSAVSTSPASSDELVPHPRRRNQSWSSNDISECKVYKAEPFSQSSRRTAADAATQTERRRRMPLKMEEEEAGEIVEEVNERGGREEIEISPPTSDSSPETLEKLMEADRRPVIDGMNLNPTAAEDSGGSVRTKASAVLMQLISCGSNSFGDCGAESAKEQKLLLIGRRVPRGAGDHVAGTSKEFRGTPGVRMEDKEYFSGSLIETKKEEIPALKRSNSYNGDRISELELKEEGEEGNKSVIGKCIPMKQAKPAARKDYSQDGSNGSKRFE